jgi:hypothetical protein
MFDYCLNKWGPCHDCMACPQVDIGNYLQIWSVAENILNKYPNRGQPTRGGPPSWGLGSS